MFMSLLYCYAFSVSNVTVSGVLTLSNIFFFLHENNTGACVQHNDHMCQIRSSKIKISSSFVRLHAGYHHWLRTSDLVLIFCSSVPVLA